jgi:hypothetical protein
VHILNELIATGMLYFAVFPDRESQFVDDDVFLKAHNRLLDLAPEAKSWDRMIKVVDPENAVLRANSLKKEVIGWITTPTHDTME